MKMFKVGDRVRFKQGYMQYPVGSTGTVTGVKNCQSGKILVSVTVDGRETTFVYSGRLELIEKTGFNVSTATDQELADEIRRVWKEYVPLFLALKSRGYMLAAYGCDGRSEPNYRVFKTVEQKIEL
jgi:hypothetical protein